MADTPLANPKPVRALRPALFYVIVAFVLVADQVSKVWVQRALVFDESRPLLGDAFLLTLTHNTGGAWGMMPNGNLLFSAFACFAALALVVAYHRMPRVSLLVGAAFALALGGALGNLSDRLRHGYVVDFFDARIIHWPVFNIADAAITMGIALLMMHFIRDPRSQGVVEKPAPLPTEQPETL